MKYLVEMNIFPLIWNYFHVCILAVASLTAYLEARVWPSSKTI